MNFTLLVSYAARGVQVLSTFVIIYIVTNFTETGLILYGKYILILSTAGFLSSLTTSRTGEAVTKFYIQFKKSKRPEFRDLSIKYGMYADLLFAAVLSFIIILLSGIISERVLKDPIEISSVQYFSIIAAVDILSGTPLSILQAERKFILINLIYISRYSLNIAAIMIFVYFTDSLNLQYIVISQSISSVIYLFILCIFYISLMNATQVRPFSRPSSSFAKEFVKFNVISFTGTVFKASSKNIDRIILGIVMDANTVGLYEVLRKATSPLNFITSPFQLIYYPKLIELASVNRFKYMSLIIKRVNFRFSGVIILISVSMIIVLPMYLLLFDVEWSSEYRVLMFLILVSAYFNNLQWWSRSFANATDPMLSIYSNVIATVFLISLTVSLTRNFGIWGYSVALIGVALSTYIFWLVAFKKISRKGYAL